MRGRQVTLHTVLVPVRDENGWGRLRLEERPEYKPNRERLTAALASLRKAYKHLPNHIDGEFDNALHDVERCVQWSIALGERAFSATPPSEGADDE